MSIWSRWQSSLALSYSGMFTQKKTCIGLISKWPRNLQLSPIAPVIRTFCNTKVLSAREQSRNKLLKVKILRINKIKGDRGCHNVVYNIFTLHPPPTYLDEQLRYTPDRRSKLAGFQPTLFRLNKHNNRRASPSSWKHSRN